MKAITLLKKSNVAVALLATAFITALAFMPTTSTQLKIKKGSHIILIGNNLGSRMMNFGYFETELQLRYPENSLVVRNMCDGGNTPGFRPHSGRPTPWAFPGAERFQTELARNAETEGFLEYPDEWITKNKADITIAMFGFDESFQGRAGLENYKAELDAFIKHTLKQKYNGVSAPQLAIVSPIAFEDLSKKFDLPNGKTENINLMMYKDAMKEVAARNKVLFIDAFTPSKAWLDNEATDLTIDGTQLSDAGYAKFSPFLVDAVFGKSPSKAEANRALVLEAVLEKDWMWHNDFKAQNGVHVFGRRYDPFGPDNYPAEQKKIREMIIIRDEAILIQARKAAIDLIEADPELNHPDHQAIKHVHNLHQQRTLSIQKTALN